MNWLWFGVALIAGLALLIGLAGLLFYFYLCRRYLHFVVRIFREKPLFYVPRGEPVADAEDVRFLTADGLSLAGCYLRGTGPRRGVILFGPEFGSDRWSCVPYCGFLLAAGYDIFAAEFRCQGNSDPQPGYEPMQWVTDHEVRDVQAALRYLNSPDADPRGVGLFGISKGAGAGLLAAADDPTVRCFVTDGLFGTHTTMVPYMRQWMRIYVKSESLYRLLPTWFLGLIGRAALAPVRRACSCRFPPLEKALPRLAPRPLLMIHGSRDTYIKPEMARQLFDYARGSKELWFVDGARHNQALQVAGEEYRRRVLEFFGKHLT